VTLKHELYLRRHSIAERHQQQQQQQPELQRQFAPIVVHIAAVISLLYVAAGEADGGGSAMWAAYSWRLA
jgi:ABC-type transport system involved in cytochrome bd biosynthesis fused ATPase/permease subunit